MNEIADQHQLKLCCCLLHLCSLLQVHWVLALIYYFALAVSCCSAAFVLWCCLAGTESVEVIPSWFHFVFDLCRGIGCYDNLPRWSQLAAHTQ